GGVIDNQGDSNTSLGTQAGGSGTLKIDGAGSAWKYSGTSTNANYISVGGLDGTAPGGMGTLLIQNSGSGQFGRTIIGVGTDAVGTLTVDTNATLESGDIYFGADGGQGTANIIGGG